MRRGGACDRVGEDRAIRPVGGELASLVAQLAQLPLSATTLRANASAPRRGRPRRFRRSMPMLQCFCRANRIAGEDQLTAPARRRSARGRRWVPPAPGSRPSLTSGRPTGRPVATRIVAGKRDFETAAERGAVDRGNDRLRRCSPSSTSTSCRPGALRRLAEFGDVGAGDEGAAGAGQHDRLDGGIGERGLEASTERPWRRRSEGIDGWIVDGQQRDAVAYFVVNVSDECHE